MVPSGRFVPHHTKRPVLDPLSPAVGHGGKNRVPLASWHHTHHTDPWQRRNGEAEGVAAACPVTAEIPSIFFLTTFLRTLQALNGWDWGYIVHDTEA